MNASELLNLGDLQAVSFEAGGATFNLRCEMEVVPFTNMQQTANVYLLSVRVDGKTVANKTMSREEFEQWVALLVEKGAVTTEAPALDPKWVALLDSYPTDEQRQLEREEGMKAFAEKWTENAVAKAHELFPRSAASFEAWLKQMYIGVEEAATLKSVAPNNLRILLRNETRRQKHFPHAVFIGEGRRGKWWLSPDEVEAWTPRSR